MKQWAKEAMSKGAKGGHTFLKKPELGGQEGADDHSSPEEGAQGKRTVWAGLWTRPQEEQEEVARALQELEEVAQGELQARQTLGGQKVTRVATSLRGGRAKGLDHWQPKELRNLPHGGVE